jgi:hypothetical protein
MMVQPMCLNFQGGIDIYSYVLDDGATWGDYVICYFQDGMIEVDANIGT